MLIRNLPICLLVLVPVLRGQPCTLVKNIHPTGSSSPSSLSSMDGSTLFFRADDGTRGAEPFVADATGTRPLRDVRTGSSGSNPKSFTTFFNGSKLLTVFLADDGKVGEELWVTDGTSSGTKLLKDLRAGPNPSSISGLTVCGNRVFFVGSPSLGNELWLTDGTTAGTILVKDLHKSGWSASNRLICHQGRIFFHASNSSGHALWVSDGTATGTSHITTLIQGTGWPWYLASFDNMSIVVRADTLKETRIYASDGTAAGTTLLKTIVLPKSPVSTPSPLVKSGDLVFFLAEDAAHGEELWKTDLTAAGTVLVEDIQPGTTGSLVTHMRPLPGGRVIFSAFRLGREPHVSDGTASGTRMIKDLYPGLWSSWPSDFTPAGGGAFFQAQIANSGKELFFTDGTSSGTKMFCDIRTSGSSNPSDLTICNGALYFAADNGKDGRELYRVRGAAGSVENLGAGCGFTKPQLESTDILVGRTATLRGRSTPVSPGVLVVSAPTAPSFLKGLVGPDCAIWIAPAAYQLVPQPTAAHWQLKVPMPFDPKLLGIRLRLQSAYTPVPLSLSNGLQVTIGR